MAKVYTLSVVETDTETGDTKEMIVDDRYFNRLAILGELESGTMAEILVNISLMHIGSMIASSEKFKQAALMASTFALTKQFESEALEDMLLGSLEGGMQ